MFLERILIERFKLIERLELDLCGGPGLKPRALTVIIGPNGCGKTSVLQAVAMTAVGGLELNNLANEVRVHVVDRRSESPMQVEARWRVDDRSLVSVATLQPKSYSYQGHARWADAADANEADPLAAARTSAQGGAGRAWFVAAYGVHRFVAAGRPDAPKQPSVDRLRSVFSPATTLVGPHFLDHIEKSQAREVAALSKAAIRRMAKHLPGLVDIELAGRGGVSKPRDLLDGARFLLLGATDSHAQQVALPLPALAHGLQSIITWVTDILGSFAADPGLGFPARPLSSRGPSERWAESTLDVLHGTVLIDEIDLHLHPTWQRGVVAALREAFPALQFIVTTHSPIVLAQAAPSEIVRLGVDPATGSIVEVAYDRETGELASRATLGDRAYVPDPRQLTVGELMQSMFQLDSAYANANGHELRRFLALESENGDATKTVRADRQRLRKHLTEAGVTLPEGDVRRVPA